MRYVQIVDWGEDYTVQEAAMYESPDYTVIVVGMGDLAYVSSTVYKVRIVSSGARYKVRFERKLF